MDFVALIMHLHNAIFAQSFLKVSTTTWVGDIEEQHHHTNMIPVYLVIYCIDLLHISLWESGSRFLYFLQPKIPIGQKKVYQDERFRHKSLFSETERSTMVKDINLWYWLLPSPLIHQRSYLSCVESQLTRFVDIKV